MPQKEKLILLEEDSEGEHEPFSLTQLQNNASLGHSQETTEQILIEEITGHFTNAEPKLTVKAETQQAKQVAKAPPV